MLTAVRRLYPKHLHGATRGVFALLWSKPRTAEGAVAITEPALHAVCLEARRHKLPLPPTHSFLVCQAGMTPREAERVMSEIGTAETKASLKEMVAEALLTCTPPLGVAASAL